MSLDVDLLVGPERTEPCWHCDQTGVIRLGRESVFEWNITHNVATMAKEAGIYETLWRPEELGITKAAQLVRSLRDGLALLRSDPARFEKFSPDNGWGSYEGLVKFVAA